MKCPRCGAVNPDEANYCIKCAAAIGGGLVDPLETAATEVGGVPGRMMRHDALEYAETEAGLPAGKVLLGRFRIEREIGCGGMGRVYLARDEKLEMAVAIKVMREVLSRDAGAVKRLVAEARASMKLSHPNIVRVHDYHEGPVVKFLAMEYVEGETLKERLDREGKLAEGEARRIGVEISRGFELGRYEVTQGQWERVMGRNPSYFKGDPDLPVEQVSWNDAQEFIGRLNALQDGYRYRLPTEAEWEYAARAGTTGKRYGDLDGIAWYDGNSGGRTHPVGQKAPNGFGLYDMLGNVWEWCADWYDEGYYKNSPARDPHGPASGGHKVLRGGSWVDFARYARVSFRLRSDPVDRDDGLGLRVAREKE